MSARILVTGATGFIGRQLTRDLVVRGNNVRILARDADKAERLFGHDVDIRIGDLNGAASIGRACRDVEVIYHIAGIYRFGLRHRRDLWRINVEGAEHLFRSAAAAGTAKIVHLSSAGLLKKAHGGKARPDFLDEDDYPAEAPRISSYKFSKWHSEQRALTWARRGLPVVIASATCPIGGGDEAPTPTGQMVRDFLQGSFPFYCRTALNFIDVRDLSQGLQQVSENGQRGRRYLLSDTNLWLKEFLDLLAEETGMPAPRWCLPNWAIRLAGCGGEAADYLNPRSRGARVCLETASQAKEARFFDNARTRTELGWQPTRSTRESIRQAVAWFRQGTEAERTEAAPLALESATPPVD
ncbi:MAG: NAD-dependent epimerase/dehydratase family protein [Methylacidiphilales bacterium]|nr:NAD-dependent epimerase/dehydratase family protein [Candidatus Methylacidiphilales bacterium]